MSLNRKSVELLAPAGKWDVLVAAIDAGADAVYLGGKAFNMRVHRSDFNFDNDQLTAAVAFAHARNVKLYVTLNNLISTEELAPLEKFLLFLNEIQPDALLVQDLAVVTLVRKLGVKIPLHASVMMNTHNFRTVELLKNFGITRVVVGRELSLAEVSLLKLRTNIEVEYFMHGDMCFAESGQCIHSGVVFGQSGNRGRCLKPCRWPYKFVDETTGETLDDFSCKLALNDMCMFRHIPELIQAGVSSFKIEGRMRPPEFVRRLVSAYRSEIDSYIANPAGYHVNENIFSELYNNRVRDFTTTFAFGAPTTRDIGLSGEREPKIFSRAVPEANFDDDAVRNIFAEETPVNSSRKPKLTVRAATVDNARAAVVAGADLVYVGGEVFRPNRPLSLSEIESAADFVHASGKQIVLSTPRTCKDKDCSELAEFFSRIGCDIFDGISVGNLGTLQLVKSLTDTPLFADVSFSVFNPVAAAFLQSLGVVQVTASLELAFAQVRSLVENSPLPVEVIVHGATESMICDHDFAKLYLRGYDEFATPDEVNRHFALVDEAGETHSLRVDQFKRWHIFFGKELCLLPFVAKFFGAAALRIEAQNYSPEVTARVVRLYRLALDGETFDDEFAAYRKLFPKLGAGVFRFRQSKNSIGS